MKKKFFFMIALLPTAATAAGAAVAEPAVRRIKGPTPRVAFTM